MKVGPLAWLLCAVPLVGVVELALHIKQTGDVVPDSDWAAARDAVKAELKADDLVLFAPFWADPIGRQVFGDELAGLAREARPDETRFARAFEVGVRGAHRPEIAGWKRVSERAIGKVTLGVYENPAPAKVLTDLVDLVGTERVAVSRVESGLESPCVFQRGVGQPGGLGVPQGPALPGDRYACVGGGMVGVAVLHALDHHPHRCIFVSATGPNGAVRMRFSSVAFGEAVHGHTGVQWMTERTPSAEKAVLSFKAAGHNLGQNVHRVGAGWTGFELPTSDLAGTRGELVAEITGGAGGRHFCFEADTR